MRWNPVEREHDGFLLASILFNIVSKKINLLGHESHLICQRTKQPDVHISKKECFFGLTGWC